MMDSVPVSASGSLIPSLQQQQQQQQQQKKGVSFEFSNSPDLETGFEPQTRARSNTWPLPRPEEYAEGNAPTAKEGAEGGTPPHQTQLAQGGLLPVKKNSSRRNAWGNLSYADLITQAITSAPDQRLTLSQIYDWMVTNVPYFKDKGDNNSSAGWKNSIRHNLSLHNRFIRTQNEGTGKSSWWMINRDAKPGKSARRRATTMESTGSLEKRRGRSKKIADALRNGTLLAESTSSPSSSVGEGLDIYPDSPLPASGFQLSSDTFRPRASSNASSCGQLSPIPAVLGEPDWTPTYAPSYSPEQQLDSMLAGNLAETMKLESYQMYQTSPPGHQQQQPAPPPYFEYQRNNGLRTPSSFGLPPTPQSANQQRCPIHGLQPCACQMNLSPVSGMSPSYQQSEPSPTTLGNNQQQTLQYMIQSQQRQQQQQQQQQHQPQHQPAQTGPAGPSPPNTPTPCPATPSTMMGQLMGALNHSALLDDLNINIESMHGGFDCNVEEVIKHELSMGGTLDFNFQQGVMGTAAIQVSDGNIGQNGAVSQNSGVVVGTTTGNAPAGVYVSTNAATPAAPPSWVH
ncbi:forkhead box protein O isoform X2 [Odontomachus brunneus]|uniref:forkhead box protein O isoform X2 n=1 Tax=Odontomachus brunneus TaxID=486640 RepID=UPI0013F1AB07|nr:forkhead box protein O isoform X2 [Odontomachus brunneus]